MKQYAVAFISDQFGHNVILKLIDAYNEEEAIGIAIKPHVTNSNSVSQITIKQIKFPEPSLIIDRCVEGNCPNRKPPFPFENEEKM